MSLKKSFFKAITAFFILVLCTGMLFACDKQESEVQTEYGLYISDLSYDEDSLTLTVHVGLGDGNRKLDGITAHREYALTRKNAYWNLVENTFTLDGSAIYSVVNSALTQDELNHDGKFYSCLKIVFDYVTIYKSTKSDGNVTASGKNYVHSFTVTESGNTYAVLTRETPFTAAWYATLICAGIAVAAVAVAVMLARGNYARRIQR